MNLPRLIATAVLAAGVASISACTSAGTTTGSPSSAPPPSVAPSSPGPSVTGSGSASGDACGLVTAADVQSALSENVTATKPMNTSTLGTIAEIQGCALATNGSPLLGSAATTLQQLVNTLTGGAASSLDLSAAGVVVIKATTSIAVTASPSSLPNGITPVPGIGQRAFVAAATTGGGVGFAQLTATSYVLVVDAEGKQVTTDQMTTLLRTAAS